ncbi:MAG: hypothetical protein PHQ12_13700, partial [Chthoniobacteraceae bacterium]|nr:hypothetical protein [Chthoniobacteraceae bacterium]
HAPAAKGSHTPFDMVPKPLEFPVPIARMKSHTQKARKRTLSQILRTAYRRHCRDRITLTAVRQLLKR